MFALFLHFDANLFMRLTRVHYFIFNNDDEFENNNINNDEN